MRKHTKLQFRVNHKKLLRWFSLQAFTFFFITGIFLSSQANAGIFCKLTPEFSPSTIMFDPFATSNDLTHKAGDIKRSKGKYIYIKGVVRDEECVPIPNVIVQIWQTDNRGHYAWEYSSNETLLNEGEKKNPHFAYSGTAITNNLGEFSFITLLPTAMDSYTAPHINVKVYHDHFAQLETRMYFPNHPRNDKDETLQNFLSKNSSTTNEEKESSLLISLVDDILPLQDSKVPEVGETDEPEEENNNAAASTEEKQAPAEKTTPANEEEQASTPAKEETKQEAPASKEGTAEETETANNKEAEEETPAAPVDTADTDIPKREDRTNKQAIFLQRITDEKHPLGDIPIRAYQFDMVLEGLAPYRRF